MEILAAIIIFIIRTKCGVLKVSEHGREMSPLRFFQTRVKKEGAPASSAPLTSGIASVPHPTSFLNPASVQMLKLLGLFIHHHKYTGNSGRGFKLGPTSILRVSRPGRGYHIPAASHNLEKNQQEKLPSRSTPA